MRKTVIWMVGFLFAAKAFGQYTNLKFENFSTIDGLSSSTCVEIFQSKDGFLWFGTIDGLNKYDGYDFTIYRSVINDPHSISSNRIFAIEEDSRDRLWLGTGNGLNVFDKASEKFFRISHHPDDPHSISSNLIYDVLFDETSNALWIATKNGVNKLSLDGIDPAQPEKLIFTRYLNNNTDHRTIDNNEVTSILKDRDKAIWAGTAGKYLNRYDPAKDKFTQIKIDVSNPYELDHIPKAILIDNEGDFWIGNNLAKLIVWDRKKNIFSLRSFLDANVPIFHIYQDKSGMIWVATDGHGIYFIDKPKGIIQHLVNNPSDPFSISNNQPSKILEDNNGITWIATYNTGVNKLAMSKLAFGHFFHQPGNTNSLSHKIAQSVIQDVSGRIWIGTDGAGLNLFDEKTNSFKHYRNVPGDPFSLSGDKIVNLCEGYDGTIWVCTWGGGLCKLNPQTNRFTTYKHNASDPYSIGQNSIWSAAEDNQHHLWIGTQSSGLNLFDPSTERFYHYVHDPQDPSSLRNNFVLSLFIDSRNRLFVGTSTGLGMVDLGQLRSAFPDKLVFRNFQEKNLQGDRINYVTEDHDGNIWVGSDLGLNKLSPGLKLLATYTTIDGLPNNLITGIREDNHGNIWITTKSGLSRLDPSVGKFKNFNTHDGLQGMEFQSKSIDKTNDGRILIGGINGFNIFQPEKILADTLKPKLFFTDFKISNQPVKAYDTVNNRILLKEPIAKTRAITLRYDEDYISFDYLALDYNNPEKNRYAYKMSGLDRDWNYVGNKRNASYSNLAPGDYTFEVMASHDGAWDTDHTLAMKISILPPPWKTWWAYTIYTTVTMFIVWLAMRFYTRRVREEKEHELDQMKLSFFINVSHEFRTPLTLILNPIDKILSAFTNPEEVKASAITIQRSARRLLNLVNQLLDFRKTDLGKAPLETVSADIVQFSKEIFRLFNDLAIIKNIDFRFESNVDSLPMWFDPDKVEKMLTNLLSNAIKFTDPGGTVILSVSKISPDQKLRGFLNSKNTEEYVSLSVKDTGIGLKKEQVKHVFERFFHVDNSKTGTGIGLHFTKSLVALHQGEMTVESVYGKGSLFTIRLPLKIKQTGKENAFDVDRHVFDSNAIKGVEYELAIANTGNEGNAANETSYGDNGADRKPVLLIVEDNKELRLHLKNELRDQFKIREAIHGADGLEKVLKYYPDIIISDIMMPEMDGFELCRKIKTEIETSHIPVVLLTARSLEEDRIEGYQTGADEYLPKPFNIHVLKARLKNLLESRKRLKEKFMSAGGVLPAKDITTNTLDEVFLDKVTRVILDNISNPDFALENLLENVGISRSHFFRKISSLTGQNPSNFIRTVRLKYAAGLLLKQTHSIKEISYLAGFNSSAYFSKTFRELFGKTPQQYIDEQSPGKPSEVV
jgi:signal transduction histidine kinase/ligand-binding sensor domain-containing protein/DNA-binding response OmpR family regulator